MAKRRRSGERRSDALDPILGLDREPRSSASDDSPPSRRKTRKRGKSGRSLGMRILLWALLLLSPVLLGIGALAGVFYYYGKDPNLPSLRGIGDYRPEQVSRVLDRDGKPIGEIGSVRRTMVPYAQLPKVLIQAVLAAEDADFFEHEGLDYRGMVRAMYENLLRRKFAQGASTITQQVVKEMLLTPEKTMRRKIQEIILARRISQKFSKEEILQLYLNHMFFGHGRYGVEEASRFYFGHSVADLDVGEAALLAGMLQSPARLSPYKHPEAAKRRQTYVLEQMAKQEFIYEDTARKFAEAPIAVIPEGSNRARSMPEVTDSVRRALDGKYGNKNIDGLGLTVKTTIDSGLQDMARQALERGLEDLDQRQGYRGPSARLSGRALDKHRAQLKKDRTKMDDSDIVEGVVERVEKSEKDPKQGRLYVYVGAFTGVVDTAAEIRYALGTTPLIDRFRPGDVVRVRLAPERKREGAEETPLALELGPQAAMVVMDPNNRDVLALVGGYGYRLGGFDRSQRAQRQPGSAFKPFIYAAAIDSKRYTAASVVNDSPEVYQLWKPQNYEKDNFRGPVRLRTALSLSINTVAIKLLADVGLNPVRDLAIRAGITSALPDSLELSLALGANTVSPLELANAYSTFVAGGQHGEPRLISAFGDEAVPVPELEQKIRPETAYIMVSLMRSVVEAGTARAAATKLLRPAAGKTGTSNGSRDAWFVGFTPEFLAAVWVGFDDGKSLGHGEAGGRTALPLWLNFMTKALNGRPVRDFSQPPGVVVVQIDPATGLLPAPGAEGINEFFIDGTAPTESAAAPGESNNPDQMLLEKNE
jgi:penicillin-binding protein 1A